MSEASKYLCRVTALQWAQAETGEQMTIIWSLISKSKPLLLLPGLQQFSSPVTSNQASFSSQI